jgi:hypothetical protein
MARAKSGGIESEQMPNGLERAVQWHVGWGLGGPSWSEGWLCEIALSSLSGYKNLTAIYPEAC